jgi:hypothetical protein
MGACLSGSPDLLLKRGVAKEADLMAVGEFRRERGSDADDAVSEMFRARGLRCVQWWRVRVCVESGPSGE